MSVVSSARTARATSRRAWATPASARPPTPPTADSAVRRRGAVRPCRSTSSARSSWSPTWSTSHARCGCSAARSTWYETRNSGAAFSLGTGATIVLTIVALVVVVVIVRSRAPAALGGWAVALGLILGGALGNLIDRMLPRAGRGPRPRRRLDQPVRADGHVWPIFNLADSAIVCGAVLAAVAALLGIDLDGDARRAHVVSETAAAAGPRRAGRAAAGRRALPAVRPLPHRGRRPDRRRATSASTEHGRRPVRPGAGGSLLEVALPDPREPPRSPTVSTGWSCSRRRGHRGRRQAGRRRRAPESRAGRARPSSRVWPRWATGSRRPARPSARASCTGWTSGTTGVMVVAKSERAYTLLKRAFKDRAVDKRYYRARSRVIPTRRRGTIDAPIDRHPSADYKFAVVAGGRPSVTHYETGRGVPGRDAARRPPGDRPHPPDPGPHGGHPAPVRRRSHLRRRSGPGRVGSA